MELFNLGLVNLVLMTIDSSWLETLISILQFIGDVIAFILGIFSLINQFPVIFQTCQEFFSLIISFFFSTGTSIGELFTFAFSLLNYLGTFIDGLIQILLWLLGIFVLA